MQNDRNLMQKIQRITEEEAVVTCVEFFGERDDLDFGMVLDV